MSMDELAKRSERRGSSRRRYRQFVQDYKHQRLDALSEDGEGKKEGNGAPEPSGDATDKKPEGKKPGKRREYLREYLRWLWPHRYAVGVLMGLAMAGAVMEMVVPMFWRFMIDGVRVEALLGSTARRLRFLLV